MKNTIYLLFLVPMVFFGAQVCAQELGVSKSEIMGAINKFDGLNFNSETEAELKDANSKVVNNLFDIASSSDSEEEKLRRFRLAKEDSHNMFENILGEADLKKYKKKVKKELKPFKRKATLVKFLL